MDLEHIWLYFAGPIAGALLGAFLYQCCAFQRSEEKDKAEFIPPRDQRKH
jgi:hypothetical protein